MAFSRFWRSRVLTTQFWKRSLQGLDGSLLVDRNPTDAAVRMALAQHAASKEITRLNRQTHFMAPRPNFGIKHSSNNNASHGWVRKQFGLSPHEMHEFAICHMSIDEMIDHLIEIGKIQN